MLLVVRHADAGDKRTWKGPDSLRPLSPTGYLLEQLTVKPGTRAALDDRDPAWRGGPDFEDLSRAELKAEAKAVLAQGVAELTEAQELLWASDTYAVLVVFQAIDAAGVEGRAEAAFPRTSRQPRQAVNSIRSLDLRWLEVSAQQREANAAARRLLEEEPSLTRSG